MALLHETVIRDLRATYRAIAGTLTAIGAFDTSSFRVSKSQYSGARRSGVGLTAQHHGIECLGAPEGFTVRIRFQDIQTGAGKGALRLRHGLAETLNHAPCSRTGIDGGFGPTSRSVTQVFQGADDLDILPALNSKTIQVARLWCAAHSAIEVRLEIERTGWLPDTRATLDLLGPDHQVLASATGTRDAAHGIVMHAATLQRGFHAIRLTAVGLPTANPRASYSLTARYTATQDLQLGTQGPANDEEVARTQGSWGPVFALPNVGIHAHVLPNSRVLLWGRRDKPTDSLDVLECTPFIWDPKTKGIAHTPQPALADGTKVNLFCSGHTFLPDGTLFVIGWSLEGRKGCEPGRHL